METCPSHRPWLCSTLHMWPACSSAKFSRMGKKLVRGKSQEGTAACCALSPIPQPQLAEHCLFPWFLKKCPCLLCFLL